ncbi:hypothetical protein T265_12136 [Opisthorchis viverrini]|uniref:Uncharacterized protein n=1 Tax=Opisthorchis viverrini TaxID=6198 RepID=A0A074Z6G2_OPIVI|nr:hypothetical protein T265_12136 [Opisthorchis viverrini]KER18835.1 hypothetical protein T265_12136 [Opisthorchis viverrini]
MLVNISKAPLKPYQMLEILKEFATSRLQYELVLGSAHRNTLKALDVAARHAVRAWLRLPKDTPLGLFYAKVKDGGLGLTSFATTIPLLQTLGPTLVHGKLGELSTDCRRPLKNG